MNNKQISVRDFKMWFEGVVDANPTDWVPNADQWAKIKAKIDQLIEAPAVAQQVQPSGKIAIPVPGPSMAPANIPVARPGEVPPSALSMPANSAPQPPQTQLRQGPHGSATKVEEPFRESPFV